jgi:DNA modification methylase
MTHLSQLYYGDNLEIMKEKMTSESVDLIYLDPPFNSARNYNMMYTTMTGMPVSEQEEAFCDTWTLGADKIDKMHHMPLIMREYGIDDRQIQFFDALLPSLQHTQPALLSYMIYMVERLLEMKRILKPTGSIYLHCDSTASHYIKLMLDAIFGHNNFRNEIIWKRSNPHNDAKKWGAIHDTIFFYTKSSKYTWQGVYTPYDDEYIKNNYKYKDDHGQYSLTSITAPGGRGSTYDFLGITRCWRYSIEKIKKLYDEGLIIQTQQGNVPRFKRYLHTMPGIPIQDVITDISPLMGNSKERLGYPTQKPVALLERIIQASCPEGGLVFDPFCGCGTTINAALKNKRKWIGCDIAILPVKLIKEQLTSVHRLKENKHFEIDGIPVSYEQADILSVKDKHQFQHWLVEQVGGFPTVKKSNDKGIDGRLYIKTSEGLKEMVLSVKGGKSVSTDEIRELRGVLDREDKAVMAGYLSLIEPTQGMYDEAAKAGMWEHEGVKYPKMQILHVKEILEEEKVFNTPSRVGLKIASQQMTLGL